MAVDKSKSLIMAQRLKDLRTERGLSHESLRKALMEKYEIDISVDSLKNYEVSKVPHAKAYKNEGMRVEYLRCLADFYSVSSDYLLGADIPRSPDISVREIVNKTGLTEDNVASLIDHGPYGHGNSPVFVKGYEKLINDLICYASTYNASRTYSHFLMNVKISEPPDPQPSVADKPAIVKYKVMAEIISGIPEDGVDYAKGYTAISSKEYSRFLLDEFLHDLKVYLQDLYFDSDIGGIDDGNY